jgi:hypothetical protein
MVNRYRPVAGHNAKQLPLLGSLPAPYAGANGSGHRNRLTWQSQWSIPSRGRVRFGSGPWIRLISRLPSQGGSRVLIEVKLSTFAISRRQLVGKCSRHSGLKVLRIPTAPQSRSASRTRSSVRRGSR